MTKKNIIIFGATGTVGAYLCNSLKDNKDYNIIAVGSRPSDNDFFTSIGQKYVSVDIRNKEAFESLPTQAFAIIHLAGMLPARMKGYDPQKYIDINVTGTLNILEYAEKSKAEKVIYSQSISDIIHLCGDVEPISADAPTSFPLNNDHSVYSISKNAAADMVKHYSAKSGFRYFIMRFPNIYLYHPDPYYYVDGEKRYQNYRLMIDKAVKGETLEIWGNPHLVRDIVYVKDCVSLITAAIETKDAPSGTYNVGTGTGTTLEEQVKGIVEVFSPEDNRSEIVYRPDKADSIQYIFDISKNIETFGWRPKYTYLEYLQDMKIEMQEERFSKLWGKSEDYK